MDEICLYLVALTKVVKTLPEGYAQLKDHTRSLAAAPIPAPDPGDCAAPSAAPPSATAPVVVMLPLEPQVPRPLNALSDNTTSSGHSAMHVSCILPCICPGIFTGSHQGGAYHRPITGRNTGLGAPTTGAEQSLNDHAGQLLFHHGQSVL